MALENENGMVMPVSPMYGNSGFGGFGGDASWLIVLFLFAMMGGWGNGFGGGNNMYPWLNNSNQINDGFRDQMLGTQAMGIQSAVTTGFGDVQTALCGGFAGVNATVNNAQNLIAQQMYANQIAELQGMNGLQSQLAQCCCDNRLATCQTQNIVQSESAATRLAIQNGVQSVLDKMCADKIDAKNEKIVELNNKINALEANNYVQNALTAQTQYFLGLYPPTRDTTTTG
ncbi:MAG: hypothetical protein E7190_00320 [Erysipelotrichaceae bacterium]|nr:hypothetical protein [Erysipelotrichaceae bacterium]